MCSFSLGHVVYHARHKGADTPVELILSEHWLVYLYYNSKGRRIEVSVVEMFEGYEEKNQYVYITCLFSWKDFLFAYSTLYLEFLTVEKDLFNDFKEVTRYLHCSTN